MESHLQQVKNSSHTSSTSSSPSHDFSFTISLQPPSSSTKSISPTKTTSSYQQTVDLSPADEIFFHGHLLPFNFLSPRTSTVDNKDILPNVQATITKEVNTTEAKNKNLVKTKPINKSFSLFRLSKWRKGFEGNEQKQKKKLMSLDLSHAVKKYIKLLFQRRGGNRTQTNSSSYSLSYNKRDLITRRPRELFSAPASMRTSPTNSGHLRVSTAGLITSSSASTSSSSSDSTMEELQAAIQAAIAHCKNSSAVDR